MSIATVVVPVPLSGEGALVNAASLVGQKTVLLTGRFRGIYDLLGTHDDLRFVPIVQFDAGGVEGIRQTIAGSFKSLRLRAATPDTSALGTVTCEVSAVAVAGQNSFATLASLAAGFSGSSPSVDLSPLFPPSGPEVDTCLICKGSFSGLLAVEGSLDNAGWNPLGSFRVDRLPEGSPTVLEFPVLSTTDKVRYVRVTLAGTVGAGGVVVTIGGGVPTSGSTPGGSGISPVDEATSRTTSLNAAGEEILYEEPIDLDAVALGAPVIPSWSAVVSVSAPSTGTFRLYIGSTTPGNTVGSTLRATLTTSSLSDALASVAGAAFLNPGGKVLLQITGINDAPASAVSEMPSFSLRFT
jgi:hypothetical protein